jgi:hypothetical protein
MRLSRFGHLLTLQGTHAAGDAITAIALAGTLFFGVPIGEARDKVGLYLLITMAPFAVLSPLVAPLLDRRAGALRVALFVSAAGRGLLAAFMATRTQDLTLYPLAFGMLVLSRAHGVARSALTPSYVPLDRSLVWANGRMYVVGVLAGALGALPALGTQNWLGPEATLRLALLAFVAATAAALRLPRGAEAARRGTYQRGAHRILDPRLVAGGLATAGSRAVVGFSTFLIAFVLKDMGEGGFELGLTVVGAGLGWFVAALIAPLGRRLLREFPLLIASLAATGVAALILAPSFDVPRAVLLAFLIGGAASTARLCFDSLIQRDAAEDIRGRVFARYETIFQLAWVVGAAVATFVPFEAAFGLRTLAAISFGSIIFALRGLVAARSRRDLEEADLEEAEPEGQPGGRSGGE